jgi:hypothetical protein
MTVLISLIALAITQLPAMESVTIAQGLKGGYQVVASDLNGDGRPDLIALASGMPELVWFENPGWKRHLIAGNLSRMINLVVLERDARPLMVLASGFSNEAKQSPGTVSVLEPGPDVYQPWQIREIDRLPTSHRLRIAKIEDGQVVVNAPLTGADTGGPEYRGRTPLVYYRPGDWKRRLIGDENEGVMHGIHVLDWDGDGRDEILTASFSGIHLYKQAGGLWSRTEIARGDPSPWPRCGASDVAAGSLGGRRFLCAIEPWHGNQVAVYREEQGTWTRRVIDDSFVDGHTIHAVDLDGDGRDEIIAGYRASGGALYLYSAADSSGDQWQRQTLDKGGIGVASCAVADFDGDGRLEIAAIGSASANLKLFKPR